MKKKRNVIEEILAIKSRAKFEASYDYSFRFGELDAIVYELKTTPEHARKELLKYIPIATVACFEAFFSAIVKELIDHGMPFSGRIGKFNQAVNTRIDFDVLNEIQGKTLTIGDFAAHMLSFNNLDDLNSNISTLIDADMLSALKQFDKPSIFEVKMNTSRAFMKHSDEVIRSVKRTYELRHIFCHEYSRSASVEEAEILSNYAHCRLFLDQVSNFIWELLYPDAPETQAEMNMEAAADFAELDKALTQLIKDIKTKAEEKGDMHNFDPKVFDKAIRSWKKYRKDSAECTASPVVGGSMYSSLYSSAMAGKTREKIESLTNEFAYTLSEEDSD
jgi:uncharacterized protein YecT (DUF1311 family)